MKRLFAIFLLVSIAGIAEGRAAPQVLGVIAYNEPEPMACANGQCWAELVTICLQKNRPNPAAGTAYRFHGAAGAELVFTDAEGRTRRLPAAEHVRVSTSRGFTSVRIEITERKLRELGATGAGIAVGKEMSLVPVPVAGDPNPITADELAYVSGFLRPEADRWLAANDGRAQATRLVNRMVNITPRVGRMKAAERATLLSRAERSTSRPYSDEGRAGARTAFDACRYQVVDLGRYVSMRQCLEAKHDLNMLDVNNEYWRATMPGS